MKNASIDSADKNVSTDSADKSSAKEFDIRFAFFAICGPWDGRKELERRFFVLFIDMLGPKEAAGFTILLLCCRDVCGLEPEGSEIIKSGLDV